MNFQLKAFQYLAIVTLPIAVFQSTHEKAMEGLLIAIFFLVMAIMFKMEKNEPNP